MKRNIKIGDININNPVIVAPMAGVTDRPFRLICKEFGADIVYTEFVSSNGIIRENKKTLDMIRFSTEERPIGVQIFGENPKIVGKSAKMIAERFKPDIIDINFGCPVPKIANRGAGSGALKDLNLMQDITSEVINNVKNIPVTIKMRAGWDKNMIISTEAGLMLEKIGVKAITLHPRTRSQSFTGEANWNLIKELKENVNIPVIGNGDIKSPNDAIRMLDLTGCDAIMIARGVLGNPWLIKSIKNAMINKPILNINKEDKFNLCRKHFNLLLADKTEQVCINYSKKHFNWYLKDFPGASSIRKSIMSAKSIQEIKSILD